MEREVTRELVEGHQDLEWRAPSALVTAIAEKKEGFKFLLHLDLGDLYYFAEGGTKT